MAHKAAKATKKFVSKKGTLKSAIVHRKKVPSLRCVLLHGPQTVYLWAPCAQSQFGLPLQVRRIRSQKTDKAIRSEEKLKQGALPVRDLANPCLTTRTPFAGTHCMRLRCAELERDAAEQAAPVSAKDMDVDQFLDGGFLAAAESPDELSDSGTDSMPPTSANDQDESLGEDVISSRAAVRTPAAEPPSSSGEPSLHCRDSDQQQQERHTIWEPA